MMKNQNRSNKLLAVALLILIAVTAALVTILNVVTTSPQTAVAAPPPLAAMQSVTNNIAIETRCDLASLLQLTPGAQVEYEAGPVTEPVTKSLVMVIKERLSPPNPAIDTYIFYRISFDCTKVVYSYIVDSLGISKTFGPGISFVYPQGQTSPKSPIYATFGWSYTTLPRSEPKVIIDTIYAGNVGQ